MEMLKAEGLTDVERDGVGNVMGLRKGTGGGPLIVVTAHLDTVFPGGTNVKSAARATRSMRRASATIPPACRSSSPSSAR
jgi:acetylornithine deacetylase/succinyl-diaminopimelate desuccinylase-like protein